MKFPKFLRALRSPLSALRFALAFMFWVSALSLSQAQMTPCDTRTPSPKEMDEIDKKMRSVSGPVSTSSAVVRKVPVQVIVCRKDDGSGWDTPIDNAFIDSYLNNMNTKINVGPLQNTFDFYRCSDINYINSTKLYNGSINPSTYSYVRNIVNLYIYNEASVTPNLADFSALPFDPIPNTVNLRNGIASFTSGSIFHELGHTIGLFHTFIPAEVYKVPVTIAQIDHPYNGTMGRELVIHGDNVPNKEFDDENRGQAGDRIYDTPPGCLDDINQKSVYPSSATIAGCWDNDNSTPCVNGCLDNDNSTPCELGCSYDYVNCKYTGTYRDYNFDLIEDPDDILVKNYMSYTGFCRSLFTPGQHEKADIVYDAFLGDYLEEQLCGSLEDKVEIEGTSNGLTRVALKITPTGDPGNFTAAVVDDFGRFSGKLPQIMFNESVKASLTRYKSGDITSLDDDWYNGVNVFDLIAISRHILNLQPLANGYKMLAADANNSNTITTFDIVELQKLILGQYSKLPAFEQPWRFIPEMVTQEIDNGILQSAFNGYLDNPFSVDIQTSGQTSITPTQYCSPDWPFLMRYGKVRNGFDAVHIGNVAGPLSTNAVSDPPNEGCPGDVTLVMPNISVAKNKTIELFIKGYNFQNVGAFQMGLNVSKENFEYVKTESMTLKNQVPVLTLGTPVSDYNSHVAGFSEAKSVGGMSFGKENLRFVWMNENLSPKSLTDGTELIKVTLKTKQDIPNLSQAIYLDNTVLETFFLTTAGDCKGDVSLQVTANILSGIGGEADDRSSTDASVLVEDQKLFCVPNPAHDKATVVFDAGVDFSGKIVIYDVQGKQLHEMQYDFVKGRNIVSINQFSSLPNGMLTIVVSDNQQRHAVRVVKN